MVMSSEESSQSFQNVALPGEYDFTVWPRSLTVIYLLHLDLNSRLRELPGDPVVETWHFHCHGPGSVPGQGARIPQATQCGQKKKKNRSIPEHLHHSLV